MELFTKTRVVKLRSHLDKYLIAEDEGDTVRQSRNGAASRKSKWIVELVDNKPNAVRLKTLNGKYLTASDAPLLLGFTGKKVVQTTPESFSEVTLEWEVIRDGFQVKLRSWCGKLLRANGGPPPWRSTVTHDEPQAGATARLVLWDVEPVGGGETTETVNEYLSFVSSFSSVSEEVLEAVSDGYGLHGSELGSPAPAEAITPRFNFVKSFSPNFSFSPKKTNSNNNSFNSVLTRTSAMDLFHKAKAVRLRSHHDKYLYAEDDESTVSQDRSGSSKNARWTVEPVPGADAVIRLKSCYGKYLTASNQPFLLGMTGRKVLQTAPGRLDSSLEWEPIRDGAQVKLKTRYGNFLRGNGGLPPWRNSVTHDIPHRTATQDWILWEVDIVEILVVHSPVGLAGAPQHQDSLDFESSTSGSPRSAHYSRQESSDSYVGSPPKSEGRTIYYHVADESGEVDDDVVEGYSMVFKGNGVEELTRRLKEETGIEDIVVCTRSPLNGKLYPLRLQLPPNNADMHVVVLETSSKVAKDFSRVSL